MKTTGSLAPASSRSCHPTEFITRNKGTLTVAEPKETQRAFLSHSAHAARTPRRELQWFQATWVRFWPHFTTGGRRGGQSLALKKWLGLGTRTPVSPRSSPCCSCCHSASAMRTKCHSPTLSSAARTRLALSARVHHGPLLRLSMLPSTTLWLCPFRVTVLAADWRLQAVDPPAPPASDSAHTRASQPA